MHRIIGYGLLWLLLAWMSIATVMAGPRGRGPEEVDFAREVYPILQRFCFECHGAEEQEADLRLDRRRDLFDSGMIDPGDSEASELLRRIRLSQGHDERMPPIALSQLTDEHARNQILGNPRFLFP